MSSSATAGVRKILVAEGDPEVCRMVKEVLSRQGFEVVTASEGRAMLQKALAETPDAILLDTALPGMTEIDVCGMLKASKSTRHIPLAFLTDVRDAGAQKTARLAGALMLIPKPFKPEQLLTSVALLVSARPKKPAA